MGLNLSSQTNDQFRRFDLLLGCARDGGNIDVGTTYIKADFSVGDTQTNERMFLSMCDRSSKMPSFSRSRCISNVVRSSNWHNVDRRNVFCGICLSTIIDEATDGRTVPDVCIREMAT